MELPVAATNTSDPNERLFRFGVAWFGVFRLPPHDQRWRSVNQVGDAPVIAFPRVPVVIDQQGQPGVVSDPSCVVLYNTNQAYRRRALSPRGDECEYVVVHPDSLEDALRHARHGPHRSPERPFAFPSVPISARGYLRQRRLHDDLVSGVREADQLRAEEAIIALIAETLDADGARRDARPLRRAQRCTEQAHDDLVARTKLHLVARWTENPSVESVARAVHASPFHLCRVFRARTGYTLHAFLRAVRLTQSLERLADNPGDLARLALDLGFSSHAHFTSSFRAAFGLTPAQARAEGLTRRHRREMSNRVIAAA